MIDNSKPTDGRSVAGDVEIRSSLIAELFGPLGAALPAYAAVICVALVGVIFVGRPRNYVCLVAIVAITAVRIGLLYSYRRRPGVRKTPLELRGWEFAYGLLAGIWTLCLGVTSAFLMLSPSVVIQLFGATMAIGMTGGIAARHAPQPWIVVVQMIGILVPYTTAIIVQHGLDASGLVVMTILMFLGVWAATCQINANLILAMRNGLANRTLKDRLDKALNNMSHGLLMFDGEHRLEVANERFATIFGIDRHRLKPGLSLQELVEISMSRFERTNRTMEEYVAIVGEALAAQTPSKSTLDLSNGSVIEFRFLPVEDRGTVVMMEDVTEKHRAVARIEQLAHNDTLTGLLNRSSFGTFLPRAIEEAKMVNAPFSLLYLDLDGFKEVNDTLGHMIGDKLLIDVAKRLKRKLRRGDLCYRLGGDEFVVVHFAPEGADESLAARLIDEISQIFTIEHNRVSISVSIGIARYANDGTTGDELLKNADIALYNAKDAGKHTFRRFRPEMAVEALDRRARVTDLRLAIENDAIDVHFQPIVRVSTSRIETCEALLRWHHPVRGLMAADETIKLAEANGLIVELGAIVMRKACVEAAKWPATISVAVNLSPVQFRNDVVVDQIVRALTLSGLPASRLEVEITESIAFGNLNTVRTTIDRIRALGVKVSLDDFGTGYTSLSYLSQIPFDKVKIDRSFVVRLGSDPMATSLIKLMSGLLGDLGKSMVVEGVETPEQVRLLRELGSDLMQGYFFSKPLAGDVLAGILASERLPSLRIVA